MPRILRGVGGMLRDEGFDVVEARDVAEADRRLHERSAPPDLMLLDLRMPGETGLAYLERLPRPLPVPVVVLSGEASPTDAVTALRLGAADFVEKPPSPERLLTSIRNALDAGPAVRGARGAAPVAGRPGQPGGRQPGAGRGALAHRPGGPHRRGGADPGRDRGGQGAGRAGAAPGLGAPGALRGHQLRRHPRARCWRASCSATSGAPSPGANVRRLGRFEQAEGGTLLLDEIGDMPLELQAKLLRVLEEREIERLGGAGPVPIDVRVLASTHRDLRQAVAEGRFRQDLYFRLAVFPLRVPPLRDRPADLAPAAARVRRRAGGPRRRRHHHARGGGRPGRAPLAGQRARAAQLRRAAGAAARPGPPAGRRRRHHRAGLRRSAAAGPDPIAAAGAGPRPTIAGLGEKGYRALVDDFERALIRAALERTERNVAAAARLLKADRGNLYRRIQALGIESRAEPAG